MIRMLSLRLTFAVLTLLMAVGAKANSELLGIERFVESPERLGTADVRWFGMRIYSAVLHTERGSKFDWERPFSLSLTYNRAIKKDGLVKATLSELERIEGKRDDHDVIGQKLEGCFRSVEKSDVFVAIAQDQSSIRFLHNGVETCVLKHQGIRERFLGIWLSDAAREIGASRALRGFK